MEHRGVIGHRTTHLWGYVQPGSRRGLQFGAMLVVALLLGGCTLGDVLGPTDIEGDGEPGGVDPTVAPVPPVPAGSVEAGLLQVDSLEVLILESFPVQVNVVVRGSLPDACTELGEVVQERAGNAITVTIPTTRDPQALCAQAIVPVEETISLAGDFPSGAYTVTVNGVSAEFRI